MFDLHATHKLQMTVNYSKVAIVGTGAMGRGIAQIAAQAGIRTLLFDTNATAGAAARDHIADQFTKLAAKGRITEAACAAAIGKLEVG